MGSICAKEVEEYPKVTENKIQRNPNKVQGGSRVHIRAQDPSVKLALKIIHLPQEIRSVSMNDDDNRVHQTLIRNESGVLLDTDHSGRIGSMVLEDGQVVYVPQSFVADSVPEMDGPNPENTMHQNFFRNGNVDNKQISEYKMGNGPRTDDIVVELKNMNIQNVPPTEGSDYLYDPETHPAEFDAINALAVTQLLLNLYRRCLWENGQMDPPTWVWGKEPITVFPYASKAPTARYVVATDGGTPGKVEYGYFKQGSKTLFYCRSFDVLAHETGHAILDGMKPKLMREQLLEGLALHEAFGDLSAVFGVLDQVDVCEMILVQSRGDLHNKNFLPIMADGFGPQGIRNVDNDLKISDVEGEPHSLSVVLTGAIYDIIADTFDYKAKQSDLSIDAQILSDVGHHLYGVTLMAFKNAPDVKTKLRDITRNMISIEKNEFIKASMQKHFEKRELLELDIHPLPRVRPDLNIAASCCDTLKGWCKADEEHVHIPLNVSVVPVQ